jgi:RND family efflux transporter MFP subunit
LPIYAKTIANRNFREVLRTEGVIGDSNYVPFRPSVGGIVTQVLANPGQQVQKDQVLLILEHESEAAALAAAKARAQEAKIESSRFQYLADVGAATSEDAEQKQVNAISKESAYIGAKVDLKHRYIKAPFDGVIGGNFIVNVGTYVQEGKALFGLVNNDELRVDMQFPPAQAKSIELGQSVRLYSESSNAVVAEGQIEYISPFFDYKDEGNDTFSPLNLLTVYASFPNIDVGLKSGQIMQSEIQIGRRNLPAIPTNAVSMKAQQAFVFKLISVNDFLTSNQLDDKQSQAMKALPVNSLIAVESPVTLGFLQDNQFSVVKGLVAGDKVAVSQTKILSSGMPVKIIPNLPGE